MRYTSVSLCTEIMAITDFYKLFDLAARIFQGPKFQGLIGILDSRGHDLPKIQELDFLSAFMATPAITNLGVEKFSALLKALESDIHLAKPVKVSIADCSGCGEAIFLESDGNTIRASNACLYPQGPIIVTLNVPSGIMVYSDDMGHLFPFPDFNINFRKGLVETSLFMERKDCAVGYVGDNYCVVEQEEDDRNGFRIIKYVPDTGVLILPDEVFCDEDYPFYIFTDSKKYEEMLGGRNDERVYRLRVHPGVYRFIHNLAENDEDPREPFTFTTVKWMSPVS